MEILKGPEGNRAKFYESDFFVDEFDKDFKLEFNDAEFCNCDVNTPIEFKFINRNQYSMVNEEICSCVTTVTKMGETKSL